MTDSTDIPDRPGRTVRLVPTPPGFWRLVLGVCTAAFAPLFGFLLGSLTGSPESGSILDPLYWGLFAGFIVGGLGVAVAVVGGWRLWSHRRARNGQEQSS